MVLVVKKYVPPTLSFTHCLLLRLSLLNFCIFSLVKSPSLNRSAMAYHKQIYFFLQITKKLSYWVGHNACQSINNEFTYFRTYLQGTKCYYTTKITGQKTFLVNVFAYKSTSSSMTLWTHSLSQISHTQTLGIIIIIITYSVYR